MANIDKLGTERIGISLWELPPGQKAYPYHFHLAEEEVLIVLAGTPLLRTPAGSQTLSTGDVIRFPTGEQGAHQVSNEDEELVRRQSGCPSPTGASTTSGSRTRSTTGRASRPEEQR